MIFESLWPLALLLAVPVIIILYLLKPRGKDYRISSILLWDKMFKNQQARTFLEKFIHNILMYLQIVMILLLVLALMSPYIRRQGKGGENVILVLDTSGSMQHDTGEGRMRIEEAVEQARNMIASSEGAAFSIVTSDCMGTNLLAVGVRDRQSLYSALNQVECCDGPQNLRGAESVVETLRSAGTETGEQTAPAEVIVFTDGSGAEDAMNFAAYFDAQVVVMGGAVSNVANNFLSYTESGESEEERSIVCASSLTNYSDAEAALEVSLYDGKKLQEVRQLTLEAGETKLIFFAPFTWQGEPLRSEIGSVEFAGKARGDSLAADNVTYAVSTQSSRVQAVMIGEGNTYIEKAYQAATGMSLTKVGSEDALPQESRETRIYDAGVIDTGANDTGKIVFADGRNAVDTVKRVMLTVTNCDLTAGMSSFSVGVNETKVYEVPEWGVGFLWAGEQCAGYYGEHDGVKTVVVGFDIRESDFPLKAEFPIFISNAIHYLGDTSLLADNVYMAGERVVFHPQADFDVNTLTAQTRKAGLYEINAGDITEWYVVRFDTGSQSDGQLTAAGAAERDNYGDRMVKRQLRNILLAALLILMALEWILYVRQTRSRSKFYLAVRLVGVLMLLLALCGVSINRRSGTNTTVFLVDISNSNRQNLDAMEDYLRRTLQDMPGENQYGIVTFGKNSLVEQFLIGENHFSRIMSLPDKTATNFEEAVSRALAMIPAQGAGRLVILTDGRETRGELANTASALMAGQVEVLALLYETNQGQDAYVEEVKLPSYLYKGDAYSMTVTVQSNYETDAQIQIWMGSMQTDAYAVHLNRGTNRFQFRQEVTGENVESFEVKVVAAGDTCEENDSYHAYAVVESVPKVLVISGMGENSEEYERLLRSANCNYNVVSAINAPRTLETMLEYRSIVLENVYLPDLPKGFLDNIETYVKDYACGLVCCGGDDSYALGGYRESVLETLLPVDMELRGVDEIPVMVMIMVIDHSGSMGMSTGSGATNLDLAITAAQTAVDQMRSQDYVGVISFDDTYSWVVKPTLAQDREEIKRQIATIPDGGGTTIQPALWEALDGAEKCDVSIRHVILLTDGQGESTNYDKLTTSYVDGGVTLSTVAVGEGSDTRLLEQIASECGGRYYYSDMATDIPKIFAQEVFLRGDTYLQNGEFALAVGRGEITDGLFENGWPTIYGYVSATEKNASHVLIASEKDDPVLTVMQYGLGHTVAWNTDVTNQWTAGFAGESDYVQLWKRIIDYSVGNTRVGEDSVDVLTAGGYTNIAYHAMDYDEGTRVEAVYTDPEGNTQTQSLQATAPGSYEAKLDTDMTGIYNLSVRRVDGENITNAVTTAAAVQYSDEYKFDIGNEDFKAFVERYGRFLDSEENFWRQRKSAVRQRYELTPWLILLAILWFVMDIAFRRFHFLPQDTRLYRNIVSHMAGRRNRKASAENSRAEEAIQEIQKAQAESTAGTESAAPESGRRKKTSGKKAVKQEPQTLDTSALLKKRDQRNQ
ncbi:MAG: VWA domain-containing protein [Lachnospiraceae bacterium]|nr:VWA domain-containing protein [Lachnospiraceae bacterium]